jgi:hypothetical protein
VKRQINGFLEAQRCDRPSGHVEGIEYEELAPGAIRIELLTYHCAILRIEIADKDGLASQVVAWRGME